MGETMDINLSSAWRSMKQVIPAMPAGSGGVIVNTASVAGLIGAPRNPVHGVAKHGVVGATRSAALAYAARELRINSVCPGVNDTDSSNAAVRHGDMPEFLPTYLPISCAGTTADEAETAMLLYSDLASYMVGDAVEIDGEWRAM